MKKEPVFKVDPYEYLDVVEKLGCDSYRLCNLLPSEMPSKYEFHKMQPEQLHLRFEVFHEGPVILMLHFDENENRKIEFLSNRLVFLSVYRRLIILLEFVYSNSTPDLNEIKL